VTISLFLGDIKRHLYISFRRPGVINFIFSEPKILILVISVLQHVFTKTAWARYENCYDQNLRMK
jgi:hypothetical protein